MDASQATKYNELTLMNRVPGMQQLGQPPAEQQQQASQGSDAGSRLVNVLRELFAISQDNKDLEEDLQQAGAYVQNAMGKFGMQTKSASRFNTPV